jgi:hypothetical protein
MLRVSAIIIAVVALIGAPTVAAAQSQKTSGTGCYNAATCDVECRRSNIGKNCEKACANARATKPACK